MHHPRFSQTELLLFDLDGTLSDSPDLVVHTMQLAGSRIEPPIALDPVLLRDLLGVPTDEYYRRALPADRAEDSPELQRVARALYRETIPGRVRAFPGVLDTLEELKERGYLLAAFSNSGVDYFELSIEHLGVWPLFDHAECISHNNIAKPELAERIAARLGVAPSAVAVVGDRSSDYEAARAIGAACVGCLYGFGDDEPYGADATIEEFAELLELFGGR